MGSVKDEIAKNLLYYRKQSGMTQRELADRLGVKNTAVSNWESGNNSIDIETLFAASKIFGVDISEMYGRYSAVDTSPEFSPEELQLIRDYRDALPVLRDAAAKMLHDSAEESRRSAVTSA